jgi:8-oxo-dGTP pyrophosphatase MutT (NUDIX family)
MGQKLKKHSTASVYVISEGGGTRRIALVNHPHFGRWTVPGGHVEEHENQAEAALREVREETGLEVRLRVPPGVKPLQEGVVSVPIPHRIMEYTIPGDRQPWPHVHVDHIYIAEVIGTGQPAEDLGVAWFGADELPALRMFEDSRALALSLLNGDGALSDAASLGR